MIYPKYLQEKTYLDTDLVRLVYETVNVGEKHTIMLPMYHPF